MGGGTHIIEPGKNDTLPTVSTQLLPVLPGGVRRQAPRGDQDLDGNQPAGIELASLPDPPIVTFPKLLDQFVPNHAEEYRVVVHSEFVCLYVPSHHHKPAISPPLYPHLQPSTTPSLTQALETSCFHSHSPTPHHATAIHQSPSQETRQGLKLGSPSGPQQRPLPPSPKTSGSFPPTRLSRPSAPHAPVLTRPCLSPTPPVDLPRLVAATPLFMHGEVEPHNAFVDFVFPFQGWAMACPGQSGRGCFPRRETMDCPCQGLRGCFPGAGNGLPLALAYQAVSPRTDDGIVAGQISFTIPPGR